MLVPIHAVETVSDTARHSHKDQYDLQGCPPRNSRVSGPRTTQNDMMLAVEEIRYFKLARPPLWGTSAGGCALTSVSRVDLHSLESIMRHKRRASPFPDASHFTLAGEFVAVLDDGSWVPVFETNVAFVEIDKHRQGSLSKGLYWLVIGGAGLIGVMLGVAVSVHDSIRSIAAVAVRLVANVIL